MPHCRAGGWLLISFSEADRPSPEGLRPVRDLRALTPNARSHPRDIGRDRAPSVLRVFGRRAVHAIAMEMAIAADDDAPIALPGIVGYNMHFGSRPRDGYKCGPISARLPSAA